MRTKYTVETFDPLQGEWYFANYCYGAAEACRIFQTYVRAGIECRVISPEENFLRSRLKGVG